MIPAEVQQLIDKAAADRGFTLRLLDDPQAAARELGLAMSQREAAEITQYAFNVRAQAESGQKDRIYPAPIFSGDPEGKPKPKDPKPPQKK